MSMEGQPKHDEDDILDSITSAEVARDRIVATLAHIEELTRAKKDLENARIMSTPEFAAELQEEIFELDAEIEKAEALIAVICERWNLEVE